jgi:hypothetical protein
MNVLKSVKQRLQALHGVSAQLHKEHSTAQHIATSNINPIKDTVHIFASDPAYLHAGLRAAQHGAANNCECCSGLPANDPAALLAICACAQGCLLCLHTHGLRINSRTIIAGITGACMMSDSTGHIRAGQQAAQLLQLLLQSRTITCPSAQAGTCIAMRSLGSACVCMQ